MLNDGGEKFIREFLLRLWRFQVRRYISKIFNLSEISQETAVIRHFSKKRR